MLHRPTPSPSPVRRALLALAAASLLVASCSGGDDGGGGDGGDDGEGRASDPLAAAVEATRAAGSARIEGTVENRAGEGPVEGVWQAEPVAGTATIGYPTAGTTVAVDLRWIGSALYVQRPVLPEGGALPGQLAIMPRTEEELPWLRFASGGLAGVGSLAAAFQPVVVAERLAAAPDAVERHPGEDVDGVETTRYASAGPVGALGWWTNATAEIWVDGDDRVVRVRLVAPTGTIDYGVSDYGADVEVDAPPEAEIGAIEPGPGIEVTGDFVEVASGEGQGVTWSLQQAPASDGGTCWRWDASAPLAQAVTDVDGARCVPEVTADTDPTDTVQFVVDGDGTGDYDAVAVVLPDGVQAATLGFVGGTTEELAVASPLVWVGRPAPVPAHLAVTLADGAVLDCGAGAVTTAADLRDDVLTDRSASSTWSCVEAE